MSYRRFMLLEHLGYSWAKVKLLFAESLLFLSRSTMLCNYSTSQCQPKRSILGNVLEQLERWINRFCRPLWLFKVHSSGPNNSEDTGVMPPTGSDAQLV